MHLTEGNDMIQVLVPSENHIRKSEVQKIGREAWKDAIFVLVGLARMRAT
jgi:hypothetical protein